ncbi:unnamed protein product [Miscanthus lutarioriparius]|uniref:DUF659 domain-containing protein n=1 Tax=Miscanthus lutarioriparius TaxID=422564 RepID=A0A811RHL7_9POAL|nr:unnamed protein product [Miscanthus lutarioriparius]
MDAYIKKHTRSVVVVVPEVQQDSEEGEGDEVTEVELEKVPSSGTKTKQKQVQEKKKIAQASIAAYMAAAGSSKPANQKNTKSVVAMLRKTPEEIVLERHKFKISQPTLEHCTKKENKQVVDDHVADFFYENRISFNVINSRSWEIMLESIGQYGPGYRSPSMHEIREPLLERAVNKTTELRKKHEEAWKEYGCTLMSDGWTDTSHRHLINFLANSPVETFFLGLVDASSEVADKDMLADLLEKQIDKIRMEYVVQVVTDNGSNFKAAGRILMDRIPHLFWTPCAAHCLNLLLQDIGEIKEFNTVINSAKKVSRFLYKHGRILNLMRQQIGGDFVRPAVTRFATSYLTLASMYKNKNDLRALVVSEEWHNNPLSLFIEGKRVEDIILSVPFWTKLEYCLKASQPLLIALRIVDGDETPAAPEITVAIDVAKNTLKESLKDKPDLLVEISQQADDYEQFEGEGFSMPLAIRDREKKNPSCERSWSEFSSIHTKKRNRLEHKSLAAAANKTRKGSSAASLQFCPFWSAATTLRSKAFSFKEPSLATPQDRSQKRMDVDQRLVDMMPLAQFCFCSSLSIFFIV